MERKRKKREKGEQGVECEKGRQYPKSTETENGWKGGKEFSLSLLY